MKARAPSEMRAACWLNSSKKLPSRGKSFPNSIVESPRTGSSRARELEELPTPAECRQASVTQGIEVGTVLGRVEALGRDREHRRAFIGLEVRAVGFDQALQVADLDALLHRDRAPAHALQQHGGGACSQITRSGSGTCGASCAYICR